MPRRPPTSGYARIAQAEEEEEEDQPGSEDDDLFQHPNAVSSPSSQYAPIQPSKRRERMDLPSGTSSPRRPGRRRRANSGVDIKAINARLERWADEIKERFKIRRVKGKSAEDEQLEIHHSVFQAPDWIKPATKESLDLMYDDTGDQMSKLEFDDLVESVRTAIELGTHPTLITQGSSGSYFARNTKGKIVGVFKPKDEEPYANKNPKWTKWIHRNLFPFFFGRAMLIPNLSYVSEAAAYILDCQLRTNIVPYTDVVSLSSKSFFYGFWDRRSYDRKKKILPEKPGSFQVFLKGYKGATEFFREHPWPDQQTSSFRGAPKRKRRRWTEDCRPGSVPVGDSSETEDEDGLSNGRRSRTRQEFWSEELQQSFSEQLEKLVILDYIMRNTDRGTDNWMIRIDKETQKADIVVEPPNKDKTQNGEANGHADEYSRRRDNMSAAPSPERGVAIPHLGAIDNSLSWPWKHPDAWRSYPFGWLFLPVSLIGRPFSEKTRKHFLPLLTSKDWWSDTQVKLRRCFEIDPDFQERMFARQIAVMKGQAWNVVETLKLADHGPLELTRRSRVCVWDDLVEIPVAVRMERPSEELRRQSEQQQQRISINGNGKSNPKQVSGIVEEEEMDISTALASSAPASHDLLGIHVTTPSPRNPRDNPFNHSRQNSADLVPTQGRQSNELLSPSLQKNEAPFSSRAAVAGRPGAMRSRTGGLPRMSLDAPRSNYEFPAEQRRRRFSLNIRRGAGGDEDEGMDEDDGDLGFAAAAGHEGWRRKVIVERIEMVKSRPPVFTWC